MPSGTCSFPRSSAGGGADRFGGCCAGPWLIPEFSQVPSELWSPGFQSLKAGWPRSVSSLHAQVTEGEASRW
jgi:hypothetical protein